MTYEITKREQLPITIASIAITADPDDIKSAIVDNLPRVLVYIAAHGAEPAGPPVVIYSEAEGRAVQLTIGVPVEQSLPEAGGVTVSKMPEGTVATTVHKGPYEKLNDAHQALQEWATREGHSSAGISWEIYLTDPMEEREPSEYLTEVCLYLG